VMKEGEFFTVDFRKLGFQKLLSQGKIINKFKIQVEYASKKAIEKIKEKGGEIYLLKKEVKKEKTNNKKEEKNK
ncbi:hypothetical protein GOV14_04895, partial [Candidatus Pacearchaeota archaeon]|nr:hypothetical protein [Candidatus Pacearchaeota archaeon]